MIRIKSINLRKLLVKELGSLAVSVIERLEVLVTGKHIPQKMVDTVKNSKEEFDAAIGSKENPQDTKLLHAKDDICDESVQELKGLAISATLQRDEKVRGAGERVLIAIRRRGFNMQNFRIPVEVEAITLLVGDIKSSPELTADIATIGATEVVARLEPEAADVMRCWDKIQASSVTGNLTSVEGTRRLSSSLSQVFQYLDSVSDYEPEVAAAIEQINAVIEPYAITLKSRATIRENEKKEAEGK